MEYPKFKVCVRCFTFNQAKYIEDAMNGFAMQQTDFPFVCCIVDDASTDGEQDVIKKYMDMHFDYSPNSVSFEKETDYAYIHYAQHKKNKNCYFAVVFLKMNLYSKKEGFKKFEYISEWRDISEYEAICEGDDYWIAPNKLQKQVDYMEAHPMCCLSFHAHQELTKDCFVLVRRYNQLVEECPMADIILGDGGFMATNSMVYRTDKILKNEPNWAKNAPVGDLPLMLKMATQGTVAYIDEIMSVYRINTPGSWTARSMTFRYKYNFIKRKNIMWKGYDEWTNYKYHKEVFKMRRDNWIDLFKFPFAYLKRMFYGLFDKWE